MAPTTDDADRFDEHHAADNIPDSSQRIMGRLLVYLLAFTLCLVIVFITLVYPFWEKLP